MGRRRVRAHHRSVLAATTFVLLALVAIALAGFAVEVAAQTEVPTPTAVAEAGADGATPDDADADRLSNTTTFLIGAVLLSGGIWAYTNRARRFPGTRLGR